MAIDFTVNDIMHKIEVKFAPTFLPDAKKPYHLKPARQPVLDAHGVASKAEVYNMQINPRAIEEALDDGLRLIAYLVADGYRIKTDIVDISVRIPGEYDGTETELPEGVFPQARFQVSAGFRKYLKERAKAVIGGIDRADGIIGQVFDEATGLYDGPATIGRLLTIHGLGLKVEGDGGGSNTGVYFEPAEGGAPVKADIIALNKPHTLKIIVPDGLIAGKEYTLRICTQSSAKGGGALLKNPRELRSDTTLTAHS